MFKTIINKYKYQLLLFLITCILFLVNYRSGTYLTGWDNLQTELNPGLAVKRAFFSVWEEYQSFGLTAGMAHAADLPRSVFLWVASFVVPQNMIRYFYHFLMLLLGGMGAYTLFGGGIIAFFGSLFYMLNLGTVQIFYLPYEAFSTFFAFLPWGAWIFSKIISDTKHQRSKKTILIFFLINILGIPSFYTQQLFIVYFLVLGSILFGFLLVKKHEIAVHAPNIFKRGLVLFTLIFLINSFWLLPQLYFLKTNGQVVTEAKNNTLSTESVFYQNYEKGTIDNFLRLEGFYFDLKGRDNTFLFAPWKDHFSGIFVIMPYLFALLMLVGLLSTIRSKKTPQSLGMMILMLLCATGLLLATPPFSWINDVVRKLPIINQIFRSPFTKFVIPYSLVYSYFFLIGLKTAIKKKSAIVYLVIGLLIIFYSIPAFKGYFFSPEMKVKIPDDYHSIINYFKSEGKNSRIVLLPDYTFWGWFFNKWGYNGSGFLWYGIEQPIVSRTFDVWSKNSESYFWESKTAFEAEDINKLISVFDKYEIDYLLLDKSLIPVVSSYKALQYDRVNELLMKNDNIVPIFNGENISLYKINHRYPVKSFVSLSSNLSNIYSYGDITNDDQIFSENGFYTKSPYSETDVFYPFYSLTSQISSKEKNWQISEDDKYFYLNTPIDIDISNFQLFFKDSYEESVLVNNKPAKITLKIEPAIKNGSLIIRIGKKIIKNFNVNLDQTTDFNFTDDTLPQNIGYLLKINSTNRSGMPLFFYIVDETKKQSYLENRLNGQSEYFILQPRFDYGRGYSFAFQNKSFKNLPAVNNLDELSLYLFPYQALKEMKFVKNGFGRPDNSFTDKFEVNKNNYFTYQTVIDPSTTSKGADLILFQSYSPGWVALSNMKLLPHIKVNNWANGWKLDQKYEKISLIYWPQYLEFFGFVLLIAVFLLILL